MPAGRLGRHDGILSTAHDGLGSPPVPTSTAKSHPESGNCRPESGNWRRWAADSCTLAVVMTRVANPSPAKATLVGCGAASRTVASWVAPGDQPRTSAAPQMATPQVAVPVDAQAVERIVDVQQHFSVPDAVG